MHIPQHTGFLLTRHAQDTRSGIVITLWLKTESGPVKLTIENEQALFFIESSQIDNVLGLLSKHKLHFVSYKQLPIKTFGHESVSAIYFKLMKDFYVARDTLKQHGIKVYEDDFRPDERYLMERFITAKIAFVGNEIDRAQYKGNVNKIANNNEANSKHLTIKNAKCKPGDCDVHLSMISIDIECAVTDDEGHGALYSIAAYSDTEQVVFIIGDAQENSPPYIRWLEDEHALLVQFIAWFKDYDTDVIIGWNVINFDFDLLQKRCDLHNIDFAIGRDGRKPYWRKNRNSDNKYISIAGRVVLDGIDLLKTATYSFPSFSLENVARELLGIGKKVDNVESRLAEITENFINNKPALAAYNLEDSRLVWLIFEKTHLLEFAMLRAHLTGLELDRMGGSVAAFTNLYLPKLHRAGYVAPNMGDGTSGLVSPGGFVMDSIPGLYNNVLVLDFKSLYPSIIKTFNVDPMGLIEGLNSPSSAIEGFDGAYFSRDKHFLPNIIDCLWKERDKAKKEKNAALSQAIKIIMNSFYGVLGSTGCRFFDPRLSGSITKRSHELLITTKKWIEAKGYKVIYGDTDSIFVHVGDDKSADECKHLGKQLQTFINDEWQQNIQERFKVDSQLEIEFETHFIKFFMPTIRGLDIGTKKRYAGTVDKNGEQALVFKGLESVRTDWTELAKEFQQTLYHKVFNEQPVEDYVRKTVADTLAGKFDSKLIYRKRIRRNLEDYVKNVPPHVRAARLADEHNKLLKKPLKYQKKGWIEYVITVSGPQPVEYINSAIDYPFYIERQLAAIADAILPFISTSFNQITNDQLDLFR
ncbi:DNA polymerase II [Brumicola blandensis]|uniref:DNA polymerase n=1 Tax=Brumicola blandensis TaxID=3075611 RepID=A0AAW8QVF7_9ALTE|nr:DNA polymerase II [Alteromonas sp. W409]MDT0581022.1 DNA polymerase II [Alteromonas sp. W409]